MNRLMRMPVARPVTRRTHAAPADSTAGAPAVRLDPPPAHAESVTCDQVIFTSIRTPTGEGYHIVAHSPTVTYDERAELTRRSPSHGSLARADEDAVGMLAYPLASGRFAVGHCVYAGAEHTARGGLRVWTHYAILDSATYIAFGNNPLRVQRALAATIQPGVAPPQSLSPLTLPAWPRTDIAQHIQEPQPAENFIRLLDTHLRGGRWAIAGVADLAQTAEWTLDMLSVSARRQVSLSYGLAFCLGRELAITLVDCVRGGIDRLIRGHNVILRDVAADAVLADAFTPWYALIRAWAPRQRWNRISRYTAHLTDGVDSRVLARIAQLCLDLDSAETADEDAKAKLREKYADFAPVGVVEAQVFGELAEAIAPPPEPLADAAETPPTSGPANSSVQINDGGRIG